MRIYVDFTVPGQEKVWPTLIENIYSDYDALLSPIVPKEHRLMITSLILDPFLKDLGVLAERVLGFEIGDDDVAEGVYVKAIDTLTKRADIDRLISNFRHHVDSTALFGHITIIDPKNPGASYAMFDEAVIKHAEDHPGTYKVVRYSIDETTREKLVSVLERDLKAVLADLYSGIAARLKEVHLHLKPYSNEVK